MATTRKPAASPSGPATKKPGSLAAAIPPRRKSAPARAPRADKPAPAASGPSPEERRAMVAEAAYFIAERRNFAGGDPLQDWLLAERQVDALLGGSKAARRRARAPKG